MSECQGTPDNPCPHCGSKGGLTDDEFQKRLQELNGGAIKKKRRDRKKKKRRNPPKKSRKKADEVRG